MRTPKNALPRERGPSGAATSTFLAWMGQPMKADFALILQGLCLRLGALPTIWCPEVFDGRWLLKQVRRMPELGPCTPEEDQPGRCSCVSGTTKTLPAKQPCPPSGLQPPTPLHGPDPDLNESKGNPGSGLEISVAGGPRRLCPAHARSPPLDNQRAFSPQTKEAPHETAPGSQQLPH